MYFLLSFRDLHLTLNVAVQRDDRLHCHGHDYPNLYTQDLELQQVPPSHREGPMLGTNVTQRQDRFVHVHRGAQNAPPPYEEKTRPPTDDIVFFNTSTKAQEAGLYLENLD